MSIRLSLTTALVGGVFGFLLAWAVSIGGLGRSIRSGLTTFSGVASNFAGVPLAAAFIFTLGRVGLITALFESMGVDLYDTGFSLYTFWGLTLVYLYFQFPLMVLVMLPGSRWVQAGLAGGRREPRRHTGQYWRRVAFPVLLPSILGTMILLFGNAFGAHATAYALTGGSFPLATLLIGQQISGDVLNNPGLGYAVAMGMVFIMARRDPHLLDPAATLREVVGMTISTAPLPGRHRGGPTAELRPSKGRRWAWLIFIFGGASTSWSRSAPLSGGR